ncbi:Uncharacterized protein PHSC3_000387 [Chlamydiales bacterium STE3]|nr:Uncharacterized protein PHSC3_000387 [Chlamydiales bacterium STE3]
MEIAHYLPYNAMGFVPGPKETEEAFKARVAYCLNLKDQVFSQLFQKKDEAPTLSLANGVLKKTQFWYGIQPSWVQIIYSNEKLAYWHGGAAWIFQMEENSPTAAFLQLRSSFLTKEKYLGVLSTQELVVHELSHVGRMQFEEPKFEEMLAYRSSASWLARNLGPVVQSSKESLVFVLTLLMIIMVDIGFLIQGHYALYQMAMWLKVIPFGLALAGFLRLYYKKKTLELCYEKLKQITCSEQKANALLYRLTDHEITTFAQLAPAMIKEFIAQQVELRWQVIRLAYL